MACLCESLLPRLQLMTSYRPQIDRLAPMWVVILSLMLLWSQGVRLHVHSYAHEHERLSASDRHCALDHGSEVHLAIAAQDAEHHADVMSELDISPEGIPAHAGVQLFVWGLLTILILFEPLIRKGLVIPRHTIHWRLPWRFHVLSPPLRAPPKA